MNLVLDQFQLLAMAFFAVVKLSVSFVFYLLNVKLQLANLAVPLFNTLTKLSLKISSHSLLLFVNAVQLVLGFGIGAL